MDYSNTAPDAKRIIYEFLSFKDRFAFAATETDALHIHRIAKPTVNIPEYKSVEINALYSMYHNYVVTNEVEVVAELVNRGGFISVLDKYSEKDKMPLLADIMDLLTITAVRRLSQPFLRGFLSKQPITPKKAVCVLKSNVYEFVKAFSWSVSHNDDIALFAGDLSIENLDRIYSVNPYSLYTIKGRLMNRAIREMDIKKVAWFMRVGLFGEKSFKIDENNYENLAAIMKRCPSDWVYKFAKAFAKEAINISIVEEILLRLMPNIAKLEPQKIEVLIARYITISYNITARLKTLCRGSRNSA